jgi:hypothetical protein
MISVAQIAEEIGKLSSHPVPVVFSKSNTCLVIAIHRGGRLGGTAGGS